MQRAQLRASHAVAEQGGFSKAALALGLTQPSLSEQVRRLEQEFGVTLFHRRARGVEPTELGRRLLIITRQMFGSERDAQDLLSSAGTLQSGSLTLAADAPDMAAKLIAAFRVHHPGIVFTVGIANAETCMDRVLSSAADAALTAAPQIDARLVSTVVRREPLVAMVASDGALAGRAEIGFPDFVRHPLVFREARSLTQRLLEGELARHGLRATPVMVVEGREALQEAVAHRLGLGVIARAEFNADRRIATVPLLDCRAEMTEALVRLADRPPSTTLDALFRIAAGWGVPG